MNDFYFDLLRKACDECDILYTDIENKEKIIDTAINDLPEESQIYICILHPLHISSAYTHSSYQRAVTNMSKRFHIKSSMIYEMDKRIKKTLINNMKSILLSQYKKD